jgi:exopolysaccharide biosynthesis protein
MTRVATTLLILLLTTAPAAFADWQRVAEGVDYQRFRRDSIDVHVARVAVRNPRLRIVATREDDRGLTVSEFAKKNKAVIAINADYFTKEMKPVGLAMGPCGVWDGTRDTQREGVIAAGEQKVEIYPPREVLEEPEEWTTAAVSGWPMLVESCKALTPSKLPGSDAFTRAPHPRTAVGLSKSGRTMYFVVADGRREGVPGLTLARLARFMKEELGVCSAINLDGGGSSAMWIDDEIVNRPSDGQERRVADHLAVVLDRDYIACDRSTPIAPAANR